MTIQNDITKTVYSLVYPETSAILDRVLNDRDGIHDMYEEPWTKKQDNMHVTFLEDWKEWASPVVKIPNKLSYAYPTNGSSEAIRDFITYYGGLGYQFHVFEGEYEGYKAIANAFGFRITEWRRNDWRMTFDVASHFLTGKHIFILSQPSAINGNVWSEYDDFMTFLQNKIPNMGVLLDLCYVGCVTRNDYNIDMSYRNILAMTFSLSKVFGVYYHRIGGIFSLYELPGLYGNMWFKNLLSLRFGSALLKSRDVIVPDKYREVQHTVIDNLNRTGLEIIPSDVVLIGHKGIDSQSNEFRRGDYNRYCLTPAMDRMIKNV